MNILKNSNSKVSPSNIQRWAKSSAYTIGWLALRWYTPSQLWAPNWLHLRYSINSRYSKLKSSLPALTLNQGDSIRLHSPNFVHLQRWYSKWRWWLDWSQLNDRAPFAELTRRSLWFANVWEELWLKVWRMMTLFWSCIIVGEIINGDYWCLCSSSDVRRRDAMILSSSGWTGPRLIELAFSSFLMNWSTVRRFLFARNASKKRRPSDFYSIVSSSFLFYLHKLTTMVRWRGFTVLGWCQFVIKSLISSGLSFQWTTQVHLIIRLSTYLRVK